MKKYFYYIGALLFAGTLLWANPPENSSFIEEQLHWAQEQISKLETALSFSRKRCEALDRENRNLREKFASLEDDIASVEKALNLPVRDSNEPDYRLQNIRSHVENYYIPISPKKVKLLDDEDWERINFSLERWEETRERIRAYEDFVKRYSGKKIIILED